jgi:precorrin-2 dehydrogenase/sirohydrochlorin ferrochelatase
MKKAKGLASYPMFLNISGKRCVVIGGGQVARRKVRTLLEHGASVEVISPDLCPELNKLVETGEVKVRRRRYQAGDLPGAFLVITASDDSEINRQVVKEAKGKSVLVNATDDPENSDFIAPSSVRRGDMTIAISTTGRSPALARKIRTRLEKEFGDEYASLVNLIAEVRTEVKRRGIKVSGDDWQEALDLDLMLDLLQKGDREKAKVVLLDKLTRPNR